VRLQQEARAGQLEPALKGVLQRARDARGRKADETRELVSVASLRRWYQTPAQLLIPAPSSTLDVSPKNWHTPFFALTDRKQKPTLAACHEQMLAAWRPEWSDPAGAPPPSYDACVRAYKRRSEIEKLKGRHSGSALRARTFYQHRDYSDLEPFEEVHADGWCSHFLMPREGSGKWQTLEVWHFHDAATRYVTPFAIGYSESTDVILAGLRECIRVGGIPARWQTDHTSSVKNAAVLDEAVGLADRLGITWSPPQQAGNSQANGIAENFNTWLDRESRVLASYMNPRRMDERTFVLARRIMDRMERAQGDAEQLAQLRQQLARDTKGHVFGSEAEARDWLQSLAHKRNHTPHTGLPRLRDTVTGRMRCMTPAEALAAARAAGWQPVQLSDAALADAFRTHLRKKITRGTVTLHNGQRYFAPGLADREGHEVMVVPHEDDARLVWVKDLDGRLVATATLVDAKGARLETTREHTKRKRAEARIRHKEQQIAQIEREMAPPAIDYAPTGAALEGVIGAAAAIEGDFRVLPDPLPVPAEPLGLSLSVPLSVPASQPEAAPAPAPAPARQALDLSKPAPPGLTFMDYVQYAMARDDADRAAKEAAQDAALEASFEAHKARLAAEASGQPLPDDDDTPDVFDRAAAGG
jgi:putative transposase